MSKDIFIRLSPADNVIVLPWGGKKGDVVGNVTLLDDIPPCHKTASEDIARGEAVVKYGRPIGQAPREVKRGEWVHDHNLRPRPEFSEGIIAPWNGPYPHYRGRATASFMGYRRQGRARPGVRNDLWVIPASSCVRGELRHALSRYHKPYWINSVRLLDIPFTRSGARGDELEDMAIGLAGNPNAAGVLFAGLGCEDGAAGGLYSRALAEDCRVMCVSMRKSPGDAVARYLDDLAADAPRVREPFPASDLCVGISGARGIYSGLTANPALGALADSLAAQGASMLTAGTPDLFAAGGAISERITSREIYDAFTTARENDAPDSAPSVCWESGVTTTEEGALSLLPAIGECAVAGFLERGEAAPLSAGILITQGCRDEAVNCAAFESCGAQIILFATEDGTPFGSLSPTVKISSGPDITAVRRDWIDFDAGAILSGETISAAAARLEEYVLRVASGEAVAHERKGFGEAVF